MRLDRVNGKQKYGLIKVRDLSKFAPGVAADRLYDALKLLESAGIVDWGATPETEFFVIRLKDKYAARALDEYAFAARRDDPEYSEDILALARRSGPNHPNCRKPD